VHEFDESDEKRLRQVFLRAPFVRELGIRIEALGTGWFETSLVVEERHLQQDGFVHAGVLSTLADHTGGGAGWTRVPERDTVLSVEFKISFLRPAKGERLRCRAEVVRAGKSLIFTEATVYALAQGSERIVARLTQTLAVVDSAVGGRIAEA
jgi:uncharacterized protein (TIGR00369 family)